ncbi:hypothetical protein GINT2_002304 [Glugoides intestinalis]
MKIYFCLKKAPAVPLNPTQPPHRPPTIKNKGSPKKSIAYREFSSVSNIEYLEFTESLAFADVYDNLMDNELLEAGFTDFDPYLIFKEYNDFNTMFSERLSEATKEDIVIVNDSSLFLLPSMTDAFVIFRNLAFNGSFIENVPFYEEVITNLALTQKFFDSSQSLQSFNTYMMCSYEFRDLCKNGCWYIQPYADKFLIVDTIEHIKEYIKQKALNPAWLKQDNVSGRFDLALMRYFEDLQIPKIKKCILTDRNLMLLEPFIKTHPEVQIRYLHTSNDFDEDTFRAVQYMKKMYQCSISIADTTSYMQIAAEMFYCDVFVGVNYKEIGRLFRKPVIEEEYDEWELEVAVKDALEAGTSKRVVVLGEEEYLRTLLDVTGYEMVLGQPSNEDETIIRLAREVLPALEYKKEEVYYRKKNGEIYIKKSVNEVHYKKEEIHYPELIGEGSFRELRAMAKPHRLEQLEKENTLNNWQQSNKKVLISYDEVLEKLMKGEEREKVKRIFSRLSCIGNVILYTRNAADTINEWVPNEVEIYAGNGSSHRVNGEWTHEARDNIFEEVKEAMKYYSERTPGSYIEEGVACISFHYEEAKDFSISKLYTLLRGLSGKNIKLGKDAIELQLKAIETICIETEAAICIGSSLLDEEMFKVCKGISIRLGNCSSAVLKDGESYATGYLKDARECLEFLDSLLNMTDLH